jgi:hypothetical protein
MVAEAGWLAVVELLRVLAEWLSFFFADNRYRLVDSDVGPTYGDALVEFASDTLRWRLIRDRSQVLLDCQPTNAVSKRSEWFSADLLIRLIGGDRVDSGVLTEEMASWFAENLSEIEERFSAARLEETATELKMLKRLRARELFG